jgi:hypothetical protein
MRPEVVDRLADAGVATFNLAVDSVADCKELPKALQPIRSYFEYLINRTLFSLPGLACYILACLVGR